MCHTSGGTSAAGFGAVTFLGGQQRFKSAKTDVDVLHSCVVFELEYFEQMALPCTDIFNGLALGTPVIPAHRDLGMVLNLTNK